MFEVTIREILPDGSRVPVIRDGKEIPVQELDGLALLGIVSDDGVHSEICNTLLNISPANIGDILINGNETLRLGAPLAVLCGRKSRTTKPAERKESATDAAE